MVTNLIRSFLFLAMVPLLVGCYQEGNKEDCVGLSCPAGFYWPDGGEVRIAYIALPDGSELRFVTVFFIDEQKPEYMEPPALGRCFEEPSFDAEVRNYVDVGESVTLTMGDFEIVAPRLLGEDTRDFIGRTHDIAYLTETYEPTTPDFFNQKHSATTAVEQPFSDRLDQIYIPPKLDVLKPKGPGVIAVKRGQDLEIEWQEVTPPQPGVMTAGVILFLREDQGLPPITCVGPNTGRFVVSADDVDNMLPEGGIMQVGTAANEAVLTDDGRIIHMWGTNCTALPWTKVD